uniref:helix-turn-helix domain-containing protein n=1 Tax=Agathobacter sp. TaxID=2021311 RepID=UPI004057322F
MERLKLLRKQKHLTQQELADILHVSQQSVHKYEHDITSPELQTLKSMADFFNTSVDYLLEMTDVSHKIEPVTEMSLDDAELELIENYREVTSFQKKVIQAIMDEFLEKSNT